MTTQEQIDANRLNALKCTGPRTLEGKVRSAVNAVKHGLLSADILLLDEDMALFTAFRSDLLTQLAPEGHVEELLADRIVQCAWRLARAARYEQQFVNNGYYESIDPQKPDTDIEWPPDPLSVQSTIRRTFAEGEYDRLFRYEMRTERAFYRALEQLQRIHAKRTDKPAPLPIPLEPNPNVPEAGQGDRKKKI